MNIAIIQARSGSTRLPNKIFMKLAKISNLHHVYSRVSKSEFTDQIVIATTNKSIDNRVEEFCRDNNINFFRGSEDDVLDRFYRCAKSLNLGLKDNIVRITADCPLIDPSLIDNVIDFHINNKFDYTSNAINPTFPDGLDVEVFSFESLKIAWENAKLLSEREHVTPYMKNNKQKFNIGSYKNDVDLSNHRWTLDEKEDYEFINIIYENLYKKDRIFTTDEILGFLKDNPNIIKMNNEYIRNEGYLKSLKEDCRLEKRNKND